MNDREFLELLNLYIDHEICAEDALRLEAEVVTHPHRRELYDQYCRMHKACSMLSKEQGGVSPAEAHPDVIAFPAPRPWGRGSLVAAMAAAAACAVVVFDIRRHGAGTEATLATGDAPRGDVAANAPPVKVTQDAMKPVFFAHFSADQAAGAQRSFAASDTPSRVSQLNWIGDLHMPPVFSATNTEFIPKTDVKVAGLNESPNDEDSQATVEMTAFRFQR